jgi:hypothetical protein
MKFLAKPVSILIKMVAIQTMVYMLIYSLRSQALVVQA